MTAESLAGIAGVVLSLVFSYIPGLNTKYAVLDGVYKRLIMLALLVLTAGAVFGLSCAGWGNMSVVCSKEGLMGMVQVLLTAIIANQSAYLITPATAAVRRATM